MKTEKELREKLNELKSDERLTYPSATVFANAPLALIQMQLESQVALLEWALELPFSSFPLPKNEAPHKNIS